jgi:hypothetical protein
MPLKSFFWEIEKKMRKIYPEKKLTIVNIFFKKLKKISKYKNFEKF